MQKKQQLQEIILDAASFHFGIELSFLKENKKQDRNSTFRRYICFYVMKKQTLLSNDEIAAIFGLKESAIRNGINRIEAWKDIKDKRTMTDIKQIEIIIDNFNEKKIADFKSNL